MHKKFLKRVIICSLAIMPCFVKAQPVKILINHIGYENNQPKTAIVEAGTKLALERFQIIDAGTGKIVYTGKPVFSGAVNKWKQFLFWTINFTDFTTNGNYRLQLALPGENISSWPFTIGKNVLEQYTLSDIVYYFKGTALFGFI
jgi:hypothetical protein